MSEQTREALVSRLVFQRDSQRTDLLDINLTNTDLIALLKDLTDAGWRIEITAVRTDHSDDSGLGFHCHAHGFCADLWPLASGNAGDYLDAADERFQHFLRACAASPFLFQIGLAGEAWTTANAAAAGPTVFQDDGASHIHLGATDPH